MLNRLLAAIEVARPHNMLVAATCAGAGYVIAGGGRPGEILWPLVLTALVVASGNLINDYFDADIDRINKPRRPIPSGRLSESQVLILYRFGTVLLAAAAVVVLPRQQAAIVLGWQVLLYLYARWVKRLPILGNLLVGIVASSAFLFGAISTGDIAAVGFPVLFAFLFVVGRELVKSTEDVEGDRTNGAGTLPVRFGAEKAGLIAVFFLVACILAAPVPVLVGYYGFLYALVMELLLVPGLIVSSYLMLRCPNRTALNRISWLLKIEMFIGIAAMVLGQRF
jgi:geranylgeranylglycerol-phosphate geranylgeranyltransferase